ncbi:hypothetical protein HanPSC8_Chr02g0068551 [Helianthus annuus]|nr:hypothetical protein HanPSC8_Chr02g0068551 [Helianthus annuus]
MYELVLSAISIHNFSLHTSFAKTPAMTTTASVLDNFQLFAFHV